VNKHTACGALHGNIDARHAEGNPRNTMGNKKSIRLPFQGGTILFLNDVVVAGARLQGRRNDVGMCMPFCASMCLLTSTDSRDTRKKAASLEV
jgi:hypothetical protein